MEGDSPFFRAQLYSLGVKEVSRMEGDSPFSPWMEGDSPDSRKRKESRPEADQ